MQLNQRLRVCPVCQKDDRIEKVSAVYSRERHISSVAGSSYSLVGISALGQRLAPPTPPLFKSPWGGCSISFLIVIGIGAFGILVAAFAGIGPRPDYSALGAAIFWFSVVGAIIWYKQYEASRRQAQVDAQTPAYRVAYDNWNRLYYCHRDSTVF